MGFPHFNGTLCERGTLNGYKPFKFWCYEILPLVYTDALSQYEVICKIYKEMLKNAEDIAALTPHSEN